MNIDFTPLFAGLNWPPEKPWVLLITIPALILGIVPFLRLNKKRRVSSKHLIPFIIHLSLILILSTVVAGISYTEVITETNANGDVVIFVVDMSDSNKQMKFEMNEHMHNVMKAAEKQEITYPEESKTKFGLVVFGGDETGIIPNRTEASKDPNNPDAGMIIMPGGLDSSTVDFLYDYETLSSDELRDKSSVRLGIEKALDAILGVDRHDATYEDSEKRIILMSDGRENIGNSYYSLQELIDNNVDLECAYFNYLDSSSGVSEVQVIGLSTKGDAVNGQNYEATVTFNSTSKINGATISIKDVVTGETLTSMTDVSIPRGISAQRLTFVAEQYDYTKKFSVPSKYVDEFDEIRGQGIQAIKAEVSVKEALSYACANCDLTWIKSQLVGANRCPNCRSATVSRPDDVLVQNNTYYSWYKFKPQGKILIVKGSENQLSQINVEQLEKTSGYKIQQCETRAFPDTLQKLLEYDEIILMDVNFSELPTGAGANIKRFVEEVGRGLLFTSGDNIYSEEETKGIIKSMADSTTKEDDEGPKGSYVVDPDIAEILPVQLNLGDEEETIAMILVVDLSSSMKELVKNSPLICKYCLYEDVDNKSPAICPQCAADANFVTPSRYQVALSSVKKVIMGDAVLNNSEDTEPEDGETSDEKTEGEEKEKKKTLQDCDYVGVIAFNQGYHVALDNERLGDKENREKLCNMVQEEFDHFYYAHYGEKTVEDGDIVVKDTKIKINTADSAIPLSGDEYKPVTAEDGITYNWYEVTYKRAAQDEDGNYTGEGLIEETAEVLIDSRGSGKYAPGGEDKVTGDRIKSHGTAYRAPMQEASAMLTRVLNKATVQVKQIVFMSDGAPNDPGSGYEGIVERLAKSGTRTTAIGIGLTINNTDALEQLNIISTAGKGDTFLVDAAKHLDETLFQITDEISKELRNEKINAELMAYSRDSSVVFEGVSDKDGYDTIHGYYATSIKTGAETIFYVDPVRPIYAEWNYGLGRVSILMTDLGNKDWTGSLFDDTDGVKNSRLVQNILLAPIRNRVDSTGLKYSALRDDEQIILNVTTYANIADRDRKEGNLYLKEKIRATVYVQETYGDVNLWNTVGIYYATESSGNNHTLVLPTEFTDKTYVVRIEHIKTAWTEDVEDPPAIDYTVYGDDPLCDILSFAIVGQTLEEYNVLPEDEEEQDTGLVLMSSLVTNKDSSDFEDEEGEEYTSNTKVFFTNYIGNDEDEDAGYNVTRVNGFFEKRADEEESITKTYNIDIPLIILALILFIVDLIFRNFVIKRRKKKVKEMTDEEQLESMRGR